MVEEAKPPRPLVSSHSRKAASRFPHTSRPKRIMARSFYEPICATFADAVTGRNSISHRRGDQVACERGRRADLRYRPLRLNPRTEEERPGPLIQCARPHNAVIA